MSKDSSPSNIENDFVYRLIDRYFDELISLESSEEIASCITDLVDTLMGFYLLTQKNISNNSKNFFQKKIGNTSALFNDEIDNFSELSERLLTNRNLISNYEINDKDENNARDTNSSDNLSDNLPDNLLDTSNNNIDELKTAENTEDDRENMASDISSELSEALHNLCLRFNTPIFNLIIGMFFLKILFFLFSF